MREFGRGQGDSGSGFVWFATLVFAVIALLGAIGPDDAPVELTDEVAAICLACVAVRSEWLQRLVSTNRLTTREVQISRHVAFGWKNQDIAQHLGISVRTIETHLHHVYAKLGLETRVQLALLLRGHSHL